jgi:hypothetical protein
MDEACNEARRFAFFSSFRILKSFSLLRQASFVFQTPVTGAGALRPALPSSCRIRVSATTFMKNRRHCVKKRQRLWQRKVKSGSRIGVRRRRSFVRTSSIAHVLDRALSAIQYRAGRPILQKPESNGALLPGQIIGCFSDSIGNPENSAKFALNAWCAKHAMLCVNAVVSFSRQHARAAFSGDDLSGSIVPLHSASAQPDICLPLSERHYVIAAAIASHRPAGFGEESHSVSRP